MSEKNRKTTRKNKTNQAVKWPSSEDFFTLDSLVLNNEHMLTNSGSDITLRVKLMKAVKEDPKTVAVIGTKNLGHGRPQLVFAMRPVKKEVIDKALQDKVVLVNESELVPVMEINPIQAPSNPVKVTETSTVTA